jgi:pilus assembly protein CpaC
LAEPQLSARNGAKASFLAGGEFPYSVSTINGVTIIFKPYGIKLDILPRVDRNGAIRATIEAEVSSLDASVSTTIGPALLTRRTNTEFNVRNGETIVLSGLLQRDHNTSIDKVPLLGDIPVLGALFRSKRFQNKETELVIFVTPTVIDSNSPGLVDRVERTTERLQQNLGKTPYLTNPLQPGHDPARTGVRTQSESMQIAARLNTEDTQVMPDHPAVPPENRDGAIVRTQRNSTLNEQPSLPTQSSPKSDVAVAGGSALRVKKDGLVIRAEPSVNSAALLQLGYGSVVQLGAADPQPSGLGTWRNVVVGQLNGWVWADAVEPSHLQASIKPYSRSTIAQRDQAQQVLSLGGNANSSVTGRPKQFTPELPGSATEPMGTPVKQYRVALDRVALRVTPDVNAASIQNLAEGQVVEALAQAPQGYWIAVQANGKRGWAASQWLTPIASQN